MAREMNWYTLAGYDSVGTFPLETTSDGDYLCPKCGAVCTYWEGSIGQDRMGNDVQAWSFDCYSCHISSEINEGAWSDE